MKNFDVVALGELLIDFINNGNSEYNNPLFEANPGGAPANVLSMLSNLGKDVAFIGKVGNDAFGKMLSKAIEDEGIDNSMLLFDDETPTTLAFVHNDESGDRSFTFYRNPGADVRLLAEELDLPTIENSKIFHFGTLSMTHPEVEEATKKALETAKNGEAIITFDPNLRPNLWKDLKKAEEKMYFGIDNCDVLKISDDEVTFLTGNEDSRKGMEELLKDHPVKLAFLTNGPDGSVAYYDGKVIEGRPFLTEETIETTGAGDTFMACVINFVLENGLDDLTEKQLQDIVIFANAAASLVTTRKGALRSMPQKQEVLDYIEGFTK